METPFLFGIAGMVVSLVLIGLWHGAAMLFGLPAPSPDQGQGLALMLGCGGFLFGAVLAIIWN